MSSKFTIPEGEITKLDYASSNFTTYENDIKNIGLAPIRILDKVFLAERLPSPPMVAPDGAAGGAPNAAAAAAAAAEEFYIPLDDYAHVVWDEEFIEKIAPRPPLPGAQASKVALEIWKIAYSQCLLDRRDLGNEKIKVYQLIFTSMTRSSQNLVTVHDAYPRASKTKNPFLLWHIVRSTHVASISNTAARNALQRIREADYKTFEEFYIAFEGLVQRLKDGKGGWTDAEVSSYLIAALDKTKHGNALDKYMSREWEINGLPVYNTLLNEFSSLARNKKQFYGDASAKTATIAKVTDDRSGTAEAHADTMKDDDSDDEEFICPNCGRSKFHPKGHGADTKCPLRPWKCGCCNKKGHRDEYCDEARSAAKKKYCAQKRDRNKKESAGSSSTAEAPAAAVPKKAVPFDINAMASLVEDAFSQTYDSAYYTGPMYDSANIASFSDY
jgi:hypothetical protein